MSRIRVSSDPARRAALDALLAVARDDAYLNLIMNTMLTARQIRGRDAAFATELAAGTSRLQGTYDLILRLAGGREPDGFDPQVLVLLRLGCHQLLSMRVPSHAAVASTVELARELVGPKITGLVNAILRKVAGDDYRGWTDRLCRGIERTEALAIRTGHPSWIVDAYAAVLPDDELESALRANNDPAPVTLAARPGLAEADELISAGAGPGRWSPYAARWSGAPADLAAVRQGRVGVQDEGSQIVAAGLAALTAPPGPWLDLCAGPGGKSALLGGLARQDDEYVLAAELHPQRARLVQQAVRGFGREVGVIAADGNRPAWPQRRFGRVLADVPCTGLGSLRRRPESRWRRTPADLPELVGRQLSLLDSAIDAARTDGVIAYVTCSPHHEETVAVVEATLARRGDIEVIPAATMLAASGLVDRGLTRSTTDGRPGGTGGPYLQLWPHRHQTDAMFAAFLRRRSG